MKYLNRYNGSHSSDKAVIHLLGYESAKVDSEELEKEKGFITFRLELLFGEWSTEYESNFTSFSCSKDRLFSEVFWICFFAGF